MWKIMYDVNFSSLRCTRSERERFTQYGGGLVRMNVLSGNAAFIIIILQYIQKSEFPFRAPDNAFFCERKLFFFVATAAEELLKLRLGIHHLYELFRYVLPSQN